MTRAVAAPQKGYSYQALFFWLSVLQLKTNDYVESLTLECPEVNVVDDVVVCYAEDGIADRAVGSRIETDYYQLKYHVNKNGAFSSESLLDPKFSNTAESMLKRLYKTYGEFLRHSDRFRLNIVSNWGWDHRDALSGYLQEGRLRGNFEDDFLSKGKQSALGKVRERFVVELGVPAEEVMRFLAYVRFDLGDSIERLTQRLAPELRLAGLKPLDPQISYLIYDDLAWKLFQQGKHRFDSERLDAMIEMEKLRQPTPTEDSEISIRSTPQMARRPRELQAAHLDVTDLFDGRFPRNEDSWNGDIPQEVKGFLFSEKVTALPKPLYLFFDCHLSIAFLAGNLANPKFGMRIVPAQKSTDIGYEFWRRPTGSPDGELWDCVPHGSVGEEAILGVSVTHRIDQHLNAYLDATDELKPLPRLLFAPKTGVGRTSVRSGAEAWQLGESLGIYLRETLPARCRKVHLFFSVPAAMAFILGDSLRNVVPEIQLYEHDLEGETIEHRYYPSLKLPA